MKKRVFGFILALLCLCLMPSMDSIAAEEKKELNIYAMYMDTDAKGDAVLLESKGEYLLIDMGTSEHAAGILKQLKTLGATKISIMFSHLHNDHIGASSYNVTQGLETLVNAGIKIDKLYLPARENAPFSQNFPYKYIVIENFMRGRQGLAEVVYLKAGDELSFGDTTGKVIGPLKTGEMTPSQFAAISSEPNVLYENNTALSVIFTCGKTRYFTAGDNYEAQTGYLVEKYGSELRSDIMKLCHHGIGSGNSTALLKAVRPKYSFASNSGFTGSSETSGRWSVYNGLKRASKYGMCYLVGHEKKTLIYNIVDDKITLYQGNSVETGKKLTGWQQLYGADGNYREHDMYYLDSKGKPVTGVKKIGANTYCFKAGGQMEYGAYAKDKTYLGWKSYSSGDRYYTLSEDGKFAYMKTGFHEIDGNYMYFAKDGYQLMNKTDTIGIKKIGASYYALDFGGSLTVDNWESFGGKRYYFDEKGKMVRSKAYTVEGDKYYFDSKGIMQKNKIIKIGKNKYYFDKNGKMVYDRKIKVDGKNYICNNQGVVSAVKKK